MCVFSSLWPVAQFAGCWVGVALLLGFGIICILSGLTAGRDHSKALVSLTWSCIERSMETELASCEAGGEAGNCGGYSQVKLWETNQEGTMGRSRACEKELTAAASWKSTSRKAGSCRRLDGVRLSIYDLVDDAVMDARYAAAPFKTDDRWVRSLKRISSKR